jgi:hypothetical protein
MILLGDVTDEYRGILYWAVGIIILMVGVAAPVIWWLRKRLSPNEDFCGPGFTLSDLRELHKQGQMSDEEFERAKAKLIGALKAAAAQAPKDKVAGAQAPKDKPQASKNLQKPSSEG